jgi:hypothetical protein
VQVLFGMAGGIIAGYVLGCTKVFNNKYKRLVGIYGAGVSHMPCCLALTLFLGPFWVNAHKLVQSVGTQASTAVKGAFPAHAWCLHVGVIADCADISLSRPLVHLYLLLAAALLIMFFLEYFDMLSGGALGSLTVGLVTCYTWEHGQPKKLSQGPSHNFSAAVERVMAKVCPMQVCRKAC